MRGIRQEIRVPGLYEPLSHYTDAVRCGDFLFLSGKPPFDGEGNVVGGDDVAAQCRQVLENMKRVLEAAGMSFADVATVTVFLLDVNDRPRSTRYARSSSDRTSPRAHSSGQPAGRPGHADRDPVRGLQAGQRRQRVAAGSRFPTMAECCKNGPETPAPCLPKKRRTMKISFADIDGVKTRFYHEGSGPALLLIHGLGGTGDMCDPQYRRPGREPHCLRPRSVGPWLHRCGRLQGRAASGLQGPPPRQAARPCRRRRFSVGGSSYGALLSALVYFDRPDQVDKLILIGSGSTFHTAEETKKTIQAAAANAATAMVDPTLESVRNRLCNILHDPASVPEELVHAQLTSYAYPDRIDAYKRTADGLLATADSEEFRVYSRLEEIAVPTLVITGREDIRASWERAQEGSKRILNCDFHIFEKCGHLPMSEHPGQVQRPRTQVPRRVRAGRPAPAHPGAGRRLNLDASRRGRIVRGGSHQRELAAKDGERAFGGQHLGFDARPRRAVDAAIVHIPLDLAQHPHTLRHRVDGVTHESCIAPGVEHLGAWHGHEGCVGEQTIRETQIVELPNERIHLGWPEGDAPDDARMKGGVFHAERPRHIGDRFHLLDDEKAVSDAGESLSALGHHPRAPGAVPVVTQSIGAHPGRN